MVAAFAALASALAGASASLTAPIIQVGCGFGEVDFGSVRGAMAVRLTRGWIFCIIRAFNRSWHMFRRNRPKTIEIDPSGDIPPRLLDHRELIQFDKEACPELFAGTHRIAIGKMIGDDISTARLQGYLAYGGGRLVFFPPNENRAEARNLPPRVTCLLPTEDANLHVRAHTTENFNTGEINVSRFEISTKPGTAEDVCFVFLTEEIPERNGLKLQINGRLVGVVVLLTAAAVAAAIGGGIGAGLLIEQFNDGKSTSCCDHQEE